MAVLHAAAADDHVLGRLLQPPPLGVAARLDGDAVVAGVEDAVLDQHVAAGFRVTAVVVRAAAVDAQLTDNDVLALDRMDLPHRRGDDGQALDQHVLATIGLDEHRADGVAGSEHPLGHRRARLAHVAQALAVADHAGRRALDPVPPVIGVGLAVQGPLAGQGDVVLVQGVDERRIVHQLDALVPGQNVGQVGGRIARELQGRALGHVQFGLALEVDRAGQPHAGRHDHPAPAGLGGGGDGGGDSLGAVGLTALLGPELGDREVATRNGRRLDPRQDDVGLLPGVVTAGSGGGQGRRAGQDGRGADQGSAGGADHDQGPTAGAAGRGRRARPNARGWADPACRRPSAHRPAPCRTGPCAGVRRRRWRD